MTQQEQWTHLGTVVTSSHCGDHRMHILLFECPKCFAVVHNQDKHATVCVVKEITE